MGGWGKPPFSLKVARNKLSTTDADQRTEKEEEEMERGARGHCVWLPQ